MSADGAGPDQPQRRGDADGARPAQTGSRGDAHGRPVGSDMPSHLPPQNLEAEEAILGAMLMSPVAIETANDLRLRESDFYRPSHRLVFNVIHELAQRDAVDELTVVNALKARNQVAEAGGAAAVFALAQRTPAVANARAYAQEVIDQAILRGLVETGHEIARLGYEHPDEPPRLIDSAGALVSDLTQKRSAADFIDASELLAPIYDELAERAESGAAGKGLLTGFADFDRRTGGLQPGNLVIVAGRPGMGKTSFAMNIAENVAMRESEPGGVAIFSLEMEPSDLMTRMMCSVAKVDQHRIRVGVPREEDWPHLVTAVQKLMHPDRLFIADTRELTPMILRSQCRRLARQLKDKGGLRLIIIDYLQLMDGGKRFEGRTQEISFISRQLKSLALELGLPIITLSQLNRSVEQRPDKRPLMSDLRESGSIEQDADMVLFLYRPEYYMKDETPEEWRGKAELIISKLRNGQPGSDILAWLGKYTKFQNLVKEAQAAARDNRPGSSGPRATGSTRASSAAIAAAAGAAGPGGGAIFAPAGGGTAVADEGSFGPGPASGDPFDGDVGIPAPPPDAYGDIV